jgi:trimethylamine:corrinoid methyltransferase-like protein
VHWYSQNMAVRTKAARAKSVRHEAEVKHQLKAAYRNFAKKVEPDRKNEAGRDLTRAIFGEDSIAEESVFLISLASEG